MSGDEVCRLDGKKVDSVVERFKAWAYIRAIRREIYLSFLDSLFEERY